MEIWKNPENIITWLLISIAIFLILFFFIINLIKVSYKKAIEKKQIIFEEKIKYEQNLKNAIITIQDQERKEIASELHDQISNKLNLIILSLNKLDNSENNAISGIKNEIKSVISKNRDISHYLFPVEIESIGILLTLQDLAFKYSTSDFNIEIYNNSKIEFNNKTSEIQIYRVIQESLTNTLKYAKATNFSIHFRKIGNKIAILVKDNGKGFEINSINKGIGLTGIETRLNSINAAHKIKSTKNKGTKLIIVL